MFVLCYTSAPGCILPAVSVDEERQGWSKGESRERERERERERLTPWKRERERMREIKMKKIFFVIKGSMVRLLSCVFFGGFLRQ